MRDRYSDSEAQCLQMAPVNHVQCGGMRERRAETFEGSLVFANRLCDIGKKEFLALNSAHIREFSLYVILLGSLLNNLC